MRARNSSRSSSATSPPETSPSRAGATLPRGVPPCDRLSTARRQRGHREPSAG
ncbi:hypothetical protein UO65_3912 [Actinokineospora spheciospongiae]|uniref:Uncharacterized protein n=1 Tax=Actinokineospora spheciospongiae TaxID=909613 RepID=W7IWD6_9PSEU|nr:hypothetical protein UO65_3912 [Actinokineospora spheciospongiae]